MMQDCASSTSGSDSPEVGNDDKPKQNMSNSCETPIENVLTKKNSNSSALPVNVSAEVVRYTSLGTSSVPKSTGHGVPLCIHKSTTISNGPMHSVRNRNAWGRTAVSICFLDAAMVFCMPGLSVTFFKY